MWRPLAPSIPADRFGEYFTGTPNPFMIVAAEVRQDVRRSIPAVVHVDGSARPQAVRRADNPLYYDLLVAFGQLTGIPILVNTSMNVAEEPMACLPRDTIGVFDGTGADAMVVGTRLVVRG
jgi:carbamoyltransferase